jgi:hypothetical protein
MLILIGFATVIGVGATALSIAMSSAGSPPEAPALRRRE